LEAFVEGEADDGPARAYEGIRMQVDPLGEKPFRIPKEVAHQPLDRWVTPARRYAEVRHLTARQVDRWGLGYATFGRLTGRLVVPVKDHEGFARSYMARTYVDHPTRYLYPADRENSDKDTMFGEQFWPEPDHRKSATVVVVEGALNGLAVERAMLEDMPFGALGGSDPRAMFVSKIATFGRVIVLTDDDKAGKGAAETLVYQLGRHTDVVRVTLGEGCDADTVSAEELRETICRGMNQ
jgi:5S rRNA maturation endonuclease (ribonuclease M5)